MPRHDATEGGAAVRDLEARIRQTEAIAKLGMSALSGTGLPALMDEAVGLVAENLPVDYVKVLELLPDGDKLLLRAGVGWKEGYVGRATVGTSLESQAGYTLISDGPVICEDLPEEIRFKGAPLLHDHGVRSGVTVAIRVREHFFGVLGAHTRERRSFAGHEVRFLQDVSEVLGTAIERREDEEHSRLTAAEQSEKAAAAEQRFEFLAEANARLSASSLDYETVLETTTRLALPTVADWCFVDVVEPGSMLRRVTAVYSDKSEQEETLHQNYPLVPDLEHGTPKVLSTSRPELILQVNDEILRAIAHDEENLELLRWMAPRSYVCVPLHVRRRLLGAMGFVSTTRRYNEEDLALAEGLAHCAALAIDNALHHTSEAAMARELVRLGKQDARAASAPSISPDAPDLTRRQLQVLGLMAEGKPAREISQHLHLSEATVRNHVRAIKQALGARSQLEAIAQARKVGILAR